MAQLQGEGIAVALQGSVRGGWLGGRLSPGVGQRRQKKKSNENKEY